MKKFLAAARRAKEIANKKYLPLIAYEMLYLKTGTDKDYHDWLGKKTVEKLRKKFGTT